MNAANLGILCPTISELEAFRSFAIGDLVDGSTGTSTSNFVCLDKLDFAIRTLMVETVWAQYAALAYNRYSLGQTGESSRAIRNDGVKNYLDLVCGVCPVILAPSCSSCIFYWMEDHDWPAMFSCLHTFRFWVLDRS